MPSDGDRPEDKTSEEGELDPLAQPPLTRPPPRPLRGDRPGRAPDQDQAQDAPETETEMTGADADPASGESGQTNAAPPARARGRFMGFLGLLFGLAGLGAAGYLYYQLIYLAPEAVLDARFERLEAELAASEQSLEDLADDQSRALSEFAAEQARAREAAQREVLEAVNRVSEQAPPSRREWKVAELAYLLRIANHRLLMERDVTGALGLLKAADTILQELDDFALYQVRAQLSDEILALESVQSNDVQGLFLRLEAIKTEISAQSVKLPRFEQADVQAAEEPGFWSALWTQIGGYMRFRRFEGESVRPLLAPEEEAYLELNLRLMLERAQLAALRREQAVYEQSLQTAADWISDYLDDDEPGVQRALEELDLLSTVMLDQPLPDISGSLSALKALGEA